MSTRLTAACVAVHIPWDKVDSYSDPAKHAKDSGVAPDPVNSITRQVDDCKPGSAMYSDHIIRQKAIDHCFACAFVCLDAGHHAPGRNIEFIVAQLLRVGSLRVMASFITTVTPLNDYPFLDRQIFAEMTGGTKNLTQTASYEETGQ